VCVYVCVSINDVFVLLSHSSDEIVTCGRNTRSIEAGRRWERRRWWKWSVYRFASSCTVDEPAAGDRQQHSGRLSVALSARCWSDAEHMP